MHDVHLLEEVTSTNDALLERALEGAPDGAAVIARRQTAGRGRRGRSWVSLPGEHLFMSSLWRPPEGFDPARLTGITLAVGVAVCDALGGLGAVTRLKWPNDLWIGGRKVAGILSELHGQATHPFVIIGVGVDVNGDDLPGELAATATTLSRQLGREVAIGPLGEQLVEAIRQACAAYSARGGPDVEAYGARCLTIGREVLVEGRRGRAYGIAHDGALLVTWNDMPGMPPERVVAGDVELFGTESVP